MGRISRLHDYTYRSLLDVFPGNKIQENIYPPWLVSSDLTRLELDIYIDEIKTAVEVQGLQHYIYTPFFHGSPGGFEKQLRFDREKRDLCHGNGVRLVEIATESDADAFVASLKKKAKPVYKAVYSKLETGDQRRNRVFLNKAVKDIEKRAKWAYRAIGKGNYQRANRLVAEICVICERVGIDLHDAKLLSHYNEHREDIDNRRTVAVSRGYYGVEQ